MKNIARTFRTKEQTISYFKLLSQEYEKDAHRANDELTKVRSQAKAEAYELAAFELEHNMQEGGK